MTLSYKFGEFGEANPIHCIDSNDQDVDISFGDPAQTKIYIMTESKTSLLLTITNTDFTIASPNVNWVPTKDQSETLPPGNYTGEVHVQDTGLTKKVQFEFPVFVEKSQVNLP